MWYVIKLFVREMSLLGYAKLFGYYNHIDILPIYNWFKLLEGDYTYLYKRRIVQTPHLFQDLYGILFFQMEKIEMGYFENIHKLAYLKSLYATTKKPQYLNQARSLEHRIKTAQKKDNKNPRLNDMLNYIEETFSNVGQLDPMKTSTSRFYSIYNRAVEKNKKDANRLNKK